MPGQAIRLGCIRRVWPLWHRCLNMNIPKRFYSRSQTPPSAREKDLGTLEVFSWSSTPSCDPIQAYANSHVIPIQTYVNDHMIVDLAELKIGATVPRPLLCVCGEGWERAQD